MKKLIYYFITLAVFVFLCESLHAQKVLRLTVGRFNFTLDGQGATWMSDVLSRGQYGPGIWYNWKSYPDLANDIGYHGVDVLGEGEHDGHGKALHGQSSYWIASRNWQAPATGNWGPDGAEAVYATSAEGQLYSIFVNDNGPVTLNSLINTPFPGWKSPRHVRRVDMPSIIVDGITQFPVAFDPDGNQFTVDPNLVPDGMLEAFWTDPMGVSFHERRYAWTHPDYDAIMICEVSITNTGDCNYDLDGLEKPGQNLTDFWLGVKHNLGDAYDWTDFGTTERYNGEVDWLLDYDPEKRYYWTWDGDANDIPGDDQFDPRGGPIGTGQADIPTGEFTAPEVCGIAFIYISDGPENAGANDNPNQPATFRYIEYKDLKSPVQGDPMEEAWNWITGEDGKAMYQDGFSDNPYQTVPLSQPHYEPVFGVGPYNLAPNDSIKIVLCFAVGSISEVRAIELGDKVKKGEITLAEAKKEIYETGRDDLFAKFDLARLLYLEDNLRAPYLPDPPNNLEMTSGPKEASIEWDPVDGADKYRVYRAIGGIDNGRIYELLLETTETSFVDQGLARGQNYFYYVTAVEGDLESSHFFNRAQREVVPFRAPEETAGWQDKVRVVPNPINVKGNTYKVGSEFQPVPHNSTGFNYDGGNKEQNTMLFVNLPAACTIKVYTSTGDLIKTLEHTSGSGDEKWAPVLTDDNVYPASGVYFYTIEVRGGPLKGQVGTGKIIIIR